MPMDDMTARDLDIANRRDRQRKRANGEEGEEEKEEERKEEEQVKKREMGMQEELETLQQLIDIIERDVKEDDN